MLRRRGHPATATTAPQVTLRNFNFQNLVEQCCDAEVNHVNAHAWILICSTSLLLLYPRIVYQVGGWGPRPCTPNAHAWVLICSSGFSYFFGYFFISSYRMAYLSYISLVATAAVPSSSVLGGWVGPSTLYP